MIIKSNSMYNDNAGYVWRTGTISKDPELAIIRTAYGKAELFSIPSKNPKPVSICDKSGKIYAAGENFSHLQLVSEYHMS